MNPQELIDAGAFLFPCVPNGKAPVRKGWQDISTQDITAVNAWRSQGFNLGIDCGKSGWFVVDVDNKNGKNGSATWKQWCAETGEKPLTMCFMTPTGGYHLVFKDEAGELRNRANVAEGIDFRGAGGFIVAPGSTIDGAEYKQIVDFTIVSAPGWLRTKALENQAQAKTESAIPEDRIDDEDLVEAAIAYLERADPAYEGTGGEAHTFQVACRVKDIGISREMCLELLAEHWNDRCVPPWRLDGPGAGQSLQDKVWSAYRNSQNAVGSHADTASAAVAFADHVTPHNETYEAQAEAAGISPEAPPQPQGLSFVRSKEIKLSKERHKRKWVLEGRYLRKYASVIIAPGGVGKSMLSIVDALSVASGTPLLGDTVIEQGTVWIHNAEDPMEELELRVEAAKRHFHVDPEVLLTSGRDNDLKLVIRDGRDNLTWNVNAIQAIIDFIKTHGIVLWIADPLVRMHGVKENDNDQMDEVMRVVQYIAEETGISIGLIHHTRKLNGTQGAGDADAGRGASAVNSAARLVKTLTGMSEEEAQRCPSLTPGDHKWYVRLADAKVNLLPPTNETVWYRKESVDLGIGEFAGTLVKSDITIGPPEKLNLAKEKGREARELIIEIMKRLFMHGHEPMAGRRAGEYVAVQKDWAVIGTEGSSVAKQIASMCKRRMEEPLDRNHVLRFYIDEQAGAGKPKNWVARIKVSDL